MPEILCSNIEGKPSKICPSCKVQQSYNNEDALKAALRKNQVCLSCAAKRRPKLHGKQNPNYRGGIGTRVCPKCGNTIQYRTRSAYWWAKKKNRTCQGCALNGERNGFHRYNPTACALFDKLNEVMKWNGKHALNGGEVQVFRYFLDYYEPNQNVVVEYDEPHHRYTKEHDVRRQRYLEKKLKCKVIRISSTLEIDDAIEYIRRLTTNKE